MHTDDLDSITQRIDALEARIDERLDELERHAIAHLKRQTIDIKRRIWELGAVMMALTGLGFALWRAPDTVATSLGNQLVVAVFGVNGLLFVYMQRRDKAAAAKESGKDAD